MTYDTDHFVFAAPVTEREPSLACKLGAEGKIRYRTMSSGITLTYEDNEADYIQAWVAEPKRTGIIEAEPVQKLSSKWVLA